MNKEIYKRIINVSIRGLAMGSRLFLILFIAAFLQPNEVGSFGLMIATVSFSVLLLGGDYYVHSQRELLSRPKREWSMVIYNQMRANFLLYLLILPLLILIFVFSILDWAYVPLFFTLLVFEHIAQEMNRLLIAMQKQLLASTVLFIRTGAWVFVIIPMMLFFEHTRNLNTLYIAWVVGCASAIFIGLFGIKQALPIWRTEPFNKSILLKGFKVSFLFLIATLSMRGLFTFDRYAVEIIGSGDLVGVYVFYITLIIGLYGILEPAIFSFLYPRMLESYQMKKANEFIINFKELLITTLVSCMILIPVTWLIVSIGVGFLSNQIYAEYIDALYFFILTGFFYSIGMVPHYALYSMKGDYWIIFANISSILIFFTIITFLDWDSVIKLVSFALFLSLMFTSIIKSAGLLIVWNKSQLLKKVSLR
ncbi:hypothetical protein N9K08_03885 [Gammaproteobacteria bacterium]|nr:hypothetical protein [Gammaproteobacteria bacterium]MDA9118104.1 hypothetical protein [Gammaproteobacteria bacterium]